MDTLLQDLRQTIRSLLRSPVFMLVAVATLALGIGANTAIYSLVHHVLFKPLPYLATDRLVALWEVAPSGNDHNEFSPGAYREMRDRAKSLDRVVAHAWATANITGGDGAPERAQAFRVSPDFFETLGMEPLLGRGFRAGEDEVGRNTIAVLTHELWTRRYGSDSGIIGKTLTVNGTPREIVGVM